VDRKEEERICGKEELSAWSKIEKEYGNGW